MAEFPYMPFYIDAYMADTSHLSTLEHGTYMLLLFAAWRRPGCDLPDDDRLLAKYAKQPLNRWLAKLRPVIEPFFEVVEGSWRQKKQTAIREHLGVVADKRRGAAAARYAPKPLTDIGSGPANAPANAPESKTKAKEREIHTVAVDSDSGARAVATTTAGQAAPREEVPAELVREIADRVAVLGKTPRQVRDTIADMIEHCGSAPLVRIALRDALGVHGDPLAYAWGRVRGQTADARQAANGAVGPPRPGPYQRGAAVRPDNPAAARRAFEDECSQEAEAVVRKQRPDLQPAFDEEFWKLKAEKKQQLIQARLGRGHATVQ